jgi:hypothetical protein
VKKHELVVKKNVSKTDFWHFENTVVMQSGAYSGKTYEKLIQQTISGVL